ncbi:hypothetical protein, partial [Gelidibacter salicanalis]|uniref:hypothetical protein n=1 Tax=Gelidibacter salicanalis TaxID=291193 RepID=UPI001F3A1A13
MIKYEKSTKYLGVILDEKLSWTQHIDHKINKALALLFQVSNSIGRTWGPIPKLSRWAYTGIVRTGLTYAAHLWAHHLKARHKVRLRRLNRLAA